MVNIVRGVKKLSKGEHDIEHSLVKSLGVSDKEYVHFLKLDTEKKARILNAAYDEFIEKGYGEASTNAIIKKASISKGLLFHYFGSKQGLYKFLMKDSAHRIAEETLTDLPDKSGDVFTIIKSIIRLKIKVCFRFPKETNFLLATWSANLPEELSKEREGLLGVSSDYLEILIGRLDENLLREGVEKALAAEIIAWVCEKYTDKMLSSGMMNIAMENWNHIEKDLDRYMDALQGGLYK